MRGRGRGRGRGREFGEDAPKTSGPITKEPDAYPSNPSLCRAPQLACEDKKLVIFNRLLTNYWRSSEFYIPDVKAQPEIETYYNRHTADITDPEIQKQVIMSFSGISYFPDELNDSRLAVSGRRISKRKNVTTSANVEKKEGEGDGEGDVEEEVEEDFGGEDYAHDHYADEDVEDMDDGGDDGEMF